MWNHSIAPHPVHARTRATLRRPIGRLWRSGTQGAAVRPEEGDLSKNPWREDLRAPVTWTSVISAAGGYMSLALRSKIPKHRVSRFSILGIVSMILGRYLVSGHLDLLGLGSTNQNNERCLICRLAPDFMLEHCSPDSSKPGQVLWLLGGVGSKRGLLHVVTTTILRYT